MKRFKNILYVVEQGESGKLALDRAVRLAENNQAALTVVDVIPRVPANMGIPDGGPTSRDLKAAMMQEHEASLVSLVEPFRKRLDISYRVLIGIPYLMVIHEILRNGHDLVVKCPESPSWLPRLFAGDDMQLLRECPCPVWMAKPETEESYQRILAAVDVNDGYPPDELKTRQALDGAVMEIAGSLAVSEFAELHVVHAWEAYGESFLRNSAFARRPAAEVDAYVETVRHRHAELVERLMQKTLAKLGQDAMDFIKPKFHLLKGSARKEIPALAKRLAVDCLVMGTVARTGIPGFIVGNTAETILEQIECSVLAIKPPGFLTPVMPEG